MAGIIKIVFLVAFVVAIMAQDYDGGFDGGDIEGAGDGEGEFAESGGFDGGESQADFDVAEPSENHETVHSVQKRSVERANRVRRGGHGHGQGYVGPVYTYVKTDHHGNFKWGARHLVGSKYGHGGHH